MGPPVVRVVVFIVIILDIHTHVYNIIHIRTAFCVFFTCKNYTISIVDPNPVRPRDLQMRRWRGGGGSNTPRREIDTVIIILFFMWSVSQTSSRAYAPISDTSATVCQKFLLPIVAVQRTP